MVALNWRFFVLAQIYLVHHVVVLLQVSSVLGHNEIFENLGQGSASVFMHGLKIGLIKILLNGA
jgi:uncharacterized ion transporter superfamily protein YfcC